MLVGEAVEVEVTVVEVEGAEGFVVLAVMEVAAAVVIALVAGIVVLAAVDAVKACRFPRAKRENAGLQGLKLPGQKQATPNLLVQLLHCRDCRLFARLHATCLPTCLLPPSPPQNRCPRLAYAKSAS